MQQQIDKLLAPDEQLQQFLTWVKEKSDSVEAPYKPAAVRAFYNYLQLDRDLARALDEVKDRVHNSELKRSLQHLKDEWH